MPKKGAQPTRSCSICSTRSKEWIVVPSVKSKRRELFRDLSVADRKILNGIDDEKEEIYVCRSHLKQRPKKKLLVPRTVYKRGLPIVLTIDSEDKIDVKIEKDPAIERFTAKVIKTEPPPSPSTAYEMPVIKSEIVDELLPLVEQENKGEKRLMKVQEILLKRRKIKQEIATPSTSKTALSPSNAASASTSNAKLKMKKKYAPSLFRKGLPITLSLGDEDDIIVKTVVNGVERVSERRAEQLKCSFEMDDYCPFCGLITCNEDHLTAHVKMRHPEKWRRFAEYGCYLHPNCDFHAMTKEELKEHQENSMFHTSTLFVFRVFVNNDAFCPWCYIPLCSISHLQDHVEKIHPMKIKLCVETDFPFIRCGSCAFGSFFASSVYTHWENEPTCVGPLVLRRPLNRHVKRQ